MSPRNIEFFTSRFGEMIPDERPETPVISALIRMLAEELCFVGTYNGKLGIIMELEFSDERGGHQDILAVPPPGNPDFQIFEDRAALWAFVPADIATLELMERITGDALRICELSGELIG